MNLSYFQKRSIELQKCVRCLDCEGHTNSIEFVKSPMSEESREMINFLMRKGLNDKKILYEMQKVYGDHVLINIHYEDQIVESKSMHYNEPQYLKYSAYGVFSLVGLKILQKFIRFYTKK